MNDLERSLAYTPTAVDLDAVKALPVERLPKIAVVVPSFNQAAYLPQTLDSILAQGYPKIEIFVADGGSTDGTVNVLRGYADRLAGTLRYVTEKDRGQHDAVNKGIDATDGDVVAWINSDDVYLPEAFWKVVAFFHFNRCAFVCYGRNRYTDERLTPVFDYPVDWSPVLFEQVRRMMHFCLPPQPSLFFRRAAVQLSGKLISPILDYELWLRWQRSFQFYFLDDYLSLSRLHSDAKTVRTRAALIRGILATVHDYYDTVPYSWTMTLAYHGAYGDRWMSGEALPIGTFLRAKALWYWVLYNVRWLPKTMWRGGARVASMFRESLYGRP